jgi:hypothetical protein
MESSQSGNRKSGKAETEDAGEFEQKQTQAMKKDGEI